MQITNRRNFRQMQKKYFDHSIVMIENGESIDNMCINIKSFTQIELYALLKHLDDTFQAHANLPDIDSVDNLKQALTLINKGGKRTALIPNNK